MHSRFLIAVVAAVLFRPAYCHAQAAPKVILYHSFDNAIEKVDYATRQLQVSANQGARPTTPAISGKAVWFAETDADAKLRINLQDLLHGNAWTIAIWEIIDVKKWLHAPEDNLLSLLDADGKPIIKLTKSAAVFVYEDGKEIHHECFDSLYWVRHSREHLTLTWDEDDDGLNPSGGILRAYWKARPYAAQLIELKRKPVYLEIGQAMSGLGVDDLYILEGALPLRSIWELMRTSITPTNSGQARQGTDIKGLEKMLAERGAIEAKRGAAARTAVWVAKMKGGIVVEAEANPGKSIVGVSPKPNPKGEARLNGDTAASTASGKSYVEPRKNPLTFTVQVKEAGDYVLSLRYYALRMMHSSWPQNSTVKTPWTENYIEVDVTVDGKPLNSGKPEHFYPTGEYSDHNGDVEMWAWHAVNGGKKVRLSAGEHTLTVVYKEGLTTPCYDALLLSREPGPPPPHPRWIDLYRIPPAWWVNGHKTKTTGGKRIDTYEVLLRNRCDEPCSYEIVAGPDKLTRQKVGVRAVAGDAVKSTCSIALSPFEEKSFEVVFETPEGLHGFSEWANIYLWNDDVALRQKYRLWNLIKDPKAAAVPHPRLAPKADPVLQAKFREWMTTRDATALTPELKRWASMNDVGVKHAYRYAAKFLSASFEGDRIKAADTWMKMDEAEIEQYLPDGPPEYNGYGTGWERVGTEYSGKWYVQPKITKLEPEGDIDFVTKVTFEGKALEGMKEPYKKVYTKEKDWDIIGALRDTRWQSFLGTGSGSAAYGDTVLGRNHNTGISLLVDAYYLTGDPAYAKKAYQMMRILAWKYTGFTKHHYWQLFREDRSWWGGRVAICYQFKYGGRYYHPIATYGLDLMWDVLTPEERTIIEHNIGRWGIYEGMAGPLWEQPAFFAAVNREDLPFLPIGEVLDDPAPKGELGFYFDLFKDVLHPDGIHICSLGSYGGVDMYAEFMQKMEGYGFAVKDDPALRNLFTAQPSFIFSGGGVPNINDGGGINLYGVGAGFGCPTDKHYAWAKTLYDDPLLDAWPRLIAAAKRVLSGGTNKNEVMRKEYLESDLPVDRLWPNVYIAPVTGMAMLRNKNTAEPIDWVEVIFDYGKSGGRSHAHAAKLATVPSFTGQIVSMEYGYGMHGNPVAAGFHMRSYAHNVVVADGESQFIAASPVQIGNLRESHSEEQIQWIDADSDRIYKDIYMRRTLFTTDFGIVDLYLCRADKEHQYDWMFHSFGVAGTELPLKSVAKLAESGPLTFGQSPRSASTSAAVQVTWENGPITKPVKKTNTLSAHEKAFVRVHAVPSGDTSVNLFSIPIIPECGTEIDYLMLRRNAASTVFATIQEPWRESVGAKVKSLRALPVMVKKDQVADSEAYALEVTRMDGGREVFFVNYSDGKKNIGKVTTNANVATWKLDANGKVRDPRYTKGATFR